MKAESRRLHRCFSAWPSWCCWWRVLISRTCCWPAGQLVAKKLPFVSRSAAIAAGSFASFSPKASCSRCSAAPADSCWASGRPTFSLRRWEKCCRSTSFGSAGPNPAILAATFGFCVLGTLGFALGPALKLSRSAVVADLKEQAGEDVFRRRWKFLPRNPLVVVQIAFSLALLTAAALFIRGASKAASVNTGLQPGASFLIETDASLAGYEPKRAQDLYRSLNERLAALPGVERASISATIPFGMISLSKNVQRAGLQPAPDAKPATAAEGLAFSAAWNSVGSDYFTTVGLPIVRGRAFNEAEATQSGGVAVAIIDEVLAKKLWPEGDALGQRIQFAGENAPTRERQRYPAWELARISAVKSNPARRSRSLASFPRRVMGFSKATRTAQSTSLLDAAFKAIFPFSFGFAPSLPAAKPGLRICCGAPCARSIPRSRSFRSRLLLNISTATFNSGSCARARRCSLSSGRLRSVSPSSVSTA